MTRQNKMASYEVTGPLTKEPEAPQWVLATAPVGPEGGPVSPDIESAIRAALGGGEPLDGALRRAMGAALGCNFSSVRVHDGIEADALNRRLDSRAFTVGSDVFFAREAYNPDCRPGRELIAHELTHVLQQRTARTDRIEAGMIVQPAADPLEWQAEALAPLAADWAESLAPVRRSSPAARVRRRLARPPRPARWPASLIQRSLAGQTFKIVPAPNVTCHVATWYWAAQEAQQRGYTPRKALRTTLENIVGMGDCQTTLLNLPMRAWNLRKSLPPVGSVLVWKTGHTHSAVLTPRGKIRGYNQCNEARTPVTSGLTELTVADLKDECKKCYCMFEGTIVGAAGRLNL